MKRRDLEIRPGDSDKAISTQRFGPNRDTSLRDYLNHSRRTSERFEAERTLKTCNGPMKIRKLKTIINNSKFKIYKNNFDFNFFHHLTGAIFGARPVR